jgi:hypothetical protein
VRPLRAACALAVLAPLALAAAPRGRGDRPAVPAKFQRLYDELAAVLDRFESSLRSTRRGRGVTLGGEVLPANAHRGEGLFKDPTALKGSLLFIDRLKDLGAGGVSLSLSYPMLTDRDPNAERYWSFYEALAREIRQRGLKLHVKTGPIFPAKEFTELKVDYSKLDAPTYFRERARMSRDIAARLRPDYLSIANEPTSEMHILKIKFSADDYTRYVADTLRGMKRSGVLVGAGAGNWDSTDYVERFARQTDVDYIDIHVYPLASSREDYLQRAVEMARIARRAGKRVVVGEAWLYKASPRGLNRNPTAASVFANDVYSFWAPLDSQFLEALAKMAQAEGIEYVSPFWTKYFFGYLEFGKTGLLFGTPKALSRRVDQHMVGELVAGRTTATAEAYRRLAREYR